jgi:hypothetical protein
MARDSGPWSWSDSRRLPSLAEATVCSHMGASELAALRLCSKEHRRLVDEALSRLMPWLVDTGVNGGSLYRCGRHIDGHFVGV